MTTIFSSNKTIEKWDFRDNQNFLRMKEMGIGDGDVFHLTTDISVSRGDILKFGSFGGKEFAYCEIVGVFVNLSDRRKHSLEIIKTTKND